MWGGRREGEGGWYWNINALNLKSSSLPVKRTITLNLEPKPAVQRSKQMIHSALFWQLSSSPLRPPHVIFMWWMLPGLPRYLFLPVFCSHVLLRAQTEGKRGEAWEWGYKILITASNPRLSKGALGGEMKSLTGTGGWDTAEREE